MSTEEYQDQLHREIVFNIRCGARAVTNHYEKYSRRAGLRTSQVSILANLRSQGVVTIQKLSEQLFLDPSTMTRVLQPLLSEKLIQITPSDSDRRVKQVLLTEEGEKRSQEACELWMEAEQSLKEKLGDQEYQSLLNSLMTMNKVLFTE